MIKTGGQDVQTALCCLLRWGWAPGQFLQLTPAEQAFVTAGLIWEEEQRAARGRRRRG